MNFLLRTKNLLLKSSDVNLAKSLLEYYLRNKAFLEEFEPKRDSAFFTYESQYNQLEKEVVDAEQKVSFHFYIFEKNDDKKVRSRLFQCKQACKELARRTA